MLDSKGFDQWADTYDREMAEEQKGYPFEGYYEVLAYVHSLIESPQEKHILDVGVGTGLLSYVLYRKGSQIYGLDFSEKMIQAAQKRIPNGKFYCHDLNDGIPMELRNERFDYIISSYGMHHFKDYKKLTLIKKFKKLLKESGQIIIADIGFPTINDLEACRKEAGDIWDPEEHYLVADQLMAELENEGCRCTYKQISCCGGVLALSFDKMPPRPDVNVEYALFPR